MNISPKTRVFAVLGHPIAHSLSPRMHNASFAATGMDAVYLAFDVSPERLMNVLPVMAEMGFQGVNLTVPLKETAFRGLNIIDESAQRLGSVNTVKICPDGLKGYSTDGDGFLTSFKEEFGVSMKGLTVFMLGCGGAGRAVAIACAFDGAKKIILANRTKERAEKLCGEIESLDSGAQIEALSSAEEWADACRDADVVIQATSADIHGDGLSSLLPPKAFRPGQLVYDIVYTRPETAFMQTAAQAGAKTANGLGMLLYQGALSFKIWTGMEPDANAMRRALETAVYPQSSVS